MKKQLLLLGAAFLFITSCSKTSDNNIAPAAKANDNSAAAANKTTDNSAASAISKDGQPKVAGKSEKSISGSLTYTPTTAFDLSCNCETFTSAGNYSGIGTLTHLGLATSKIKPCIAPLFNAGGTQIGDHVGVECGTLVAADGDELYCHIPSYNVIFGTTAAVGTVTVDFEGGTGKFHCATGSMTGTSSLSFSTGVVTLTGITGTINY